MFLSPDDFLADSYGVDCSDFSDVEAVNVVTDASAMVESYLGISLDYQVVLDELHPWPMKLDDSNNSFRGKVFPKTARPIRTITNFEFIFGVNTPDAKPVSFPVPFTPTYTNPDVAGSLPFTAGQLFYDRASSFVEPVYIMLNVGIFEALPSLSLNPPRVAISYTAGYDDGTVQADGLSIVRPSWLVASTRITAAALATERRVNKDGLAGLNEARNERTQVTKPRRDTSPWTIEDIPELAKTYLKNHRRFYIKSFN